jgi:UDP-3-O-[3-hydroxymyristoyl] glucosamine N-acyltransferase
MSKEFKVGDRVRVAKQSTNRIDKDAVVGDVVRVTGSTGIGHHLTIGSLAVIQSVRSTKSVGFAYDCQGSDNDGALDQTVCENDLEKFDIKGE